MVSTRQDADGQTLVRRGGRHTTYIAPTTPARGQAGSSKLSGGDQRACGGRALAPLITIARITGTHATGASASGGGAGGAAK